MQAKFVQNAASIDYVAGSGGVAAGDIITFGGIVGVAKNDIPEGATGAIALEGVYDVRNLGVAISSGAAVYFNATSGGVTTVASGSVLFGHAIEAVASSAATVRVVLNK